MSLLPTDENGNIIRYDPNTGQYVPVNTGIGSDQNNPYAPSTPPIQSQQATHDFDPNTGLSREAWRDQFMGLGSISPQAADQWLRSHGGMQQSGKGDIWQTPYGDTLDLQIGRGAANANGGNIMPAWTSTGSGQSQGSVLNPQGSIGNGGNYLQQLLQMFMGGSQNQPQMSNGAQPYSPYGNQQQGVSNYFNNRTPTGQTDGTLLGTQFGPSMNQQNSMAQAQPNQNMSSTTSSGMVQKPQYSWNSGKAPSMSSNFGAPSSFSGGSDNSNQMLNRKPLPNNNMMGTNYEG